MGVQCQLTPRIHRTLKGYLSVIAPDRIHSGNKIAFITMFRTPTRHRTTEGAVDIKAERAVKKAMYSQKHVGLIIQAQEEAFSKLLAYITPTKNHTDNGIQTKSSTKNLKGVRKLAF